MRASILKVSYQNGNRLEFRVDSDSVREDELDGEKHLLFTGRYDGRLHKIPIKNIRGYEEVNRS